MKWFILLFIPTVVLGYCSCANSGTCTATDPCCSKYGWCGHTSQYCGLGSCTCGCWENATIVTGSSALSPSCLPNDCETVTIFEDTFSSYTEGQSITDYTHYDYADFPNGGTSLSNNPSSKWEEDTGYFWYSNGYGHSGLPNAWADRYFFRLNTRHFGAGNCVVSWKYKSAAFGANGFGVEGSDAVDLWLRYQTQYNLYIIQFDRTDNIVVAKRKVPAQGFSGNTGDISNKGVYYVLPSDSSSPSGAGITWDIKWPTGMPNLAHDSTTVYSFQASIVNLANGNVQLKLWRDGTLCASWTDDGKIGIAASGATQGGDVSAGYYTSVSGWQTWWGNQITRPGATGFRADNIQCYFDDFVVKNLTGGNYNDDGSNSNGNQHVSSNNNNNIESKPHSNSNSADNNDQKNHISSSAVHNGNNDNNDDNKASDANKNIACLSAIMTFVVLLLKI